MPRVRSCAGAETPERPGERLGRGGAVVPREGGLGRKDAEGDLDEVGVVGVVGVVAGEHESALGAGVAGLEVAERAGERAGEAGGRAASRRDPTETRAFPR